MNMMIFAGAVSVATAAGFGVVAIRHWRAQRRRVVDGLGLDWDHNSALDLSAGLAIAAAAMMGIFFTEFLNAGITRGAVVNIASPSLLKAAAIMMTAAWGEELLNRGLLLSGLAIALRGRTKLAVALSALIFGLLHLANHNATALSVIGNGLGGVIYGLAFVLSGRLWLPVGLHFAWNFVQGPLLGFPVSGFDMGGLQGIHDLGPDWLTGGSYGPEAGLIGIGFRFLVIGLLLLWTGWRRNKRASPTAPGNRYRVTQA